MTRVAAPAAPPNPPSRRPRDIRSIALDGGFLGDWQSLNTTATIPHCIARLESSGVMDNFRRLAGESEAPFRGPLFADSDLYKTLEALGWEAVRGVRRHDDVVDEAVRLIGAVQEADGYVDTYYQGPHAGERFTDLQNGHELYCLGHLVQAAIAWSAAGRDDLLEIALRFVELVHETFGEGAREEVCGHPEIETALIELSRTTGDGRHRDLAVRMIERRGHGIVGEGGFGSAYFQDLVPVREAPEVMGHAVRQLYLLAGVADAQLDDDRAGYDAALERLWRSTHDEKLYVTGGLGSRHRGEAFGDPYELPADRAYSETCAAIANLQWNWRMLLLTGEGRFADEIERGLYNAIAVSTDAAGTAFFYSNPLQLRTGHAHEEDAPSTRLDWYACACCPPNLARLLASIGAYAATETDDAVQLHLYTTGDIDLGDGATAHVETSYPWDGDVAIAIEGASPRALELRIPVWADGAELVADGVPVPVAAGEYARVPAGTRRVRLTLPVEPVLVHPHPRIDAVRGTVAVRRGPVVYCIETADVPVDVVLEDVRLTDRTRAVDGAWDDELGVRRVVLTEAEAVPAGAELYRTAPVEEAAAIGPIEAIPYFRWANRAAGAMRVWIPQA